MTAHPPTPHDSLGVVDDALHRAPEALALASAHLDPSLVDVLAILGYDREYVTAQGSYLYDTGGRAYLDFHSGEGFSTLGHNHPDVREVLQATLAADLVDGVQIQYSPLAGLLARELSRRLPRGLDAVFFANSGAEAVDSAMKFARAATGRPRLIGTDGGYHGVTYGPLSIVGEEFFKEGFGPLLPGCATVPFGDLARLEKELRRRDVAAFIVEPIQGLGVELPPPEYLKAAQDLCRRYGTLFVLDEVQTGLGRTGRWFALEHWGLEPDVVLVAKALSGGYMPVAAMVTTRAIYQRAVGTLERCYVQQSTYGRNKLSMAAGLATMRIIARDALVEHSEAMGQLLADGLAALKARHEMIRTVRHLGLMFGIELQAPSTRIARINWRLIHLASEGLFPQLIVIPLHRDHGVITMASGKNDVIKLLPPLTVTAAEIARFLEAFDAVLSDTEGSSGGNWGVVREIATTTLKRRLRRHQVPDEAPFRGTPVDPARGDVCLVTGASGFIGGHLAERLVRDGHQVRALARATSQTARLEEQGVEIAIGDLGDAAALRRAAEGCRYVLHCGAMVSDWGTVREITEVNVIGTRHLLDAAAAGGVERFVHVSSTDVYGYPGGTEVDENAGESRFRNWYSQTKRLAEAEVRRAEQAHGLAAVILRPATVYGPRSVEVVGEFAKAIRGGYMLLVGGGRANAGLVYVENMIDAAILALTDAGAPGQAFNLTDGLDITWRQFADALADGLGCAPPRLNLPYWLASGIGLTLEQGYRGLRRATRLRTSPLLSRQAVHVLGREQDFSNRKAREQLGWEPRVDYAEGMRTTLAWLRDEHLALA